MIFVCHLYHGVASRWSVFPGNPDYPSHTQSEWPTARHRELKMHAAVTIILRTELSQWAAQTYQYMNRMLDCLTTLFLMLTLCKMKQLQENNGHVSKDLQQSGWACIIVLFLWGKVVEFRNGCVWNKSLGRHRYANLLIQFFMILVMVYRN